MFQNSIYQGPSILVSIRDISLPGPTLVYYVGRDSDKSSVLVVVDLNIVSISIWSQYYG